ncbi:MAG: DUF4190 domain-containing protein [Chloroflexota bacterium]|nr:DUF4190 domain-containing protein [Chloroflexota bacterium]
MHQQSRPHSPPAQLQTSALAVVSLVASILGLTAVPTVGSAIGLVLGYVARTEIRRSALLTGEGLATAGIVLGWIGIALTLIAMALVLLVVVFGFVAIPGLTACAILGCGF